VEYPFKGYHCVEVL